MIERKIELINRLGLHARAAAKFVHLASQQSCSVEVTHGGETADAKSILGLLVLAAPCGAELTIRCDGPGEDEAMEALTRLVQERFGEDS